jgi:hypothetical protein
VPRLCAATERRRSLCRQLRPPCNCVVISTGSIGMTWQYAPEERFE